MKDQCWEVQGVHEGKPLSDLPITYLLWFLGSPIMRRTRWRYCQIALNEIKRRLISEPCRVEIDLIEALCLKPRQERLAMKARRKAYKDGHKNLL